MYQPEPDLAANYHRNEHEPSEHYTLAQLIQQDAAKFVKNLEWMTKEKSAWMVWERFRCISEFLESLRGELSKDQLIEVIDEDLAEVISDLEQACIDYDGEDCQQYFGYFIRDYAQHIIEALKVCMGKEEARIWDYNN